MDPATAMLVATAVSTAATAGSKALASKKEKKMGKYRSKEMERETASGLLMDALQRGSDIENQRLESSARLGKRRSQSMQETANLLRGAYGI